MQFERYISAYEEALKNGIRPREQSWEEFFDAQIEGLHASRHDPGQIHSYNHLIMQERWYALGKPYYKVWPTMVDLFTTTRLDIPVEALRVPYEAFAIYLPSEPILTFQDGGQDWWVHSMLIGGSEFTVRADGERVDQPALTVWVDIGEKGPNGMTVFSHQRANFVAGGTIEEGFGKIKHPTAEVGVNVPDEIMDASIRLSIAVCFLAVGGGRVVERDILSRHLEAYLAEREDSPKRQAWEEKSIKYGLGGWHIGRDRCERGLSFTRGVQYADAVRDGQSGRSLLFTHWRGAHFHTYRKGPGRNQLEVKWIEPIQVRKDLPPKPLKR